MQHERRPGWVGAFDARDQRRASRLRFEQLRAQPEARQLGRDVLGGLRLAVGLALAPVHGVEADQVARDAGGVLELGVGHAFTLSRV